MNFHYRTLQTDHLLSPGHLRTDAPPKHPHFLQYALLSKCNREIQGYVAPDVEKFHISTGREGITLHRKKLQISTYKVDVLNETQRA